MKYFLLGLKDYLSDTIHDLLPHTYDLDWKEGNLNHYIYNRKYKDYSEIFYKHYMNIEDIKALKDLKDILCIVNYDATNDIELAQIVKDDYEYYKQLSQDYNVIVLTDAEYAELTK